MGNLDTSLQSAATTNAELQRRKEASIPRGIGVMTIFRLNIGDRKSVV